MLNLKTYIERSMSFVEYIALIEELLEQGKTTGAKQTEGRFNFSKLNRQRMRRLEKTVVLNDSLREKAKNAGRKMFWLIITEGWCGDSAQNVPVIEKIAGASANIETRYVLRDENPELMDAYLTNNARSIPKLIAIDAETFEELGSWGPRPRPAMEYFYEQRAGGMEHAQISENIQRWYLQDKEQTIQKEFEDLLESIAKEMTGAQAARLQ
jgi:hypothetical protein